MYNTIAFIWPPKNSSVGNVPCLTRVGRSTIFIKTRTDTISINCGIIIRIHDYFYALKIAYKDREKKIVLKLQVYYVTLLYIYIYI